MSRGIGADDYLPWRRSWRCACLDLRGGCGCGRVISRFDARWVWAGGSTGGPVMGLLGHDLTIV